MEFGRRPGQLKKNGGEAKREGNMSPLPDLVLKDSCTGCRGTADLYGSNCGHLTLCLKCGKSMAETQAPCSECGTPVTRLIRVSSGLNWLLELKASSCIFWGVIIIIIIFNTLKW